MGSKPKFQIAKVGSTPWSPRRSTKRQPVSKVRPSALLESAEELINIFQVLVVFSSRSGLWSFRTALNCDHCFFPTAHFCLLAWVCTADLGKQDAQKSFVQRPYLKFDLHRGHVAQAMAIQKKEGTEKLQRILLEEVIKSHLLADDQRLPNLRDSEDMGLEWTVQLGRSRR